MFNKNTLASLLIIFVVSSLLVVTPTAATAGRFNSNSTLEEIVSTAWSDWSNGRSTANYQQLSETMTNPKYRDAEAAALAAMCYYLRVNKGKQLDYASACTVAEDNAVALKHYSEFVEKLTKINRDLYANSQSPNFALLQQGPVGDCFVFSGIGWLAKYRPQTIRNAIHEVSSNHNGTIKKYYDVSFPDGYKVKITEPTDAEVLFNTSPESITDGLWVTVIQKAVGTIWPKLTNGKTYDEDPTAYIDSGGTPKPFEQLWTGKIPTEYKFNQLGSTPLDTVRDLLITMNSETLLAQAGGVTPNKDDLPVPGHHVYAILAYDDSTQILTIWNPWGSNFKPKGPDGLKYGYTRNHGVFQMSLTDFYSTYAYLTVE